MWLHGRDVQEYDCTLIVLILFVPGFLMLKVYDLRVAAERRDFTKAAFDAVVYSVLNFVALLPIRSDVISAGFK